jgi:integrase
MMPEEMFSIKAAMKDQFLPLYPFIVIGLETSMRSSEILPIKLEHIDLRRHIIYIPQAKGVQRETNHKPSC